MGGILYRLVNSVNWIHEHILSLGKKERHSNKTQDFQ